MKWQDMGYSIPVRTTDGKVVEGRGAELITDCCEVKIKHWHCSCGAALHLFPITSDGREVPRSMYASAAADWHQYRFGNATVHDVVDCLGTLLQRGRHDREYPTLDPRPRATAEERLYQPLSTSPEARVPLHLRG